jgi:hypothetical protein
VRLGKKEPMSLMKPTEQRRGSRTLPAAGVDIIGIHDAVTVALFG